jgi:hypothetical protein
MTWRRAMLIAATAALLGFFRLESAFQAGLRTPAPPFPARADRWIGPPQSWAALRGQVVLLDVWTFG